jgi:hypothetical protein
VRMGYTLDHVRPGFNCTERLMSPSA